MNVLMNHYCIKNFEILGITFGELKVGRKRGLVDLDQEEVSLRNGSQQELDGDAQLVDRLLEADGR